MDIESLNFQTIVDDKDFDAQVKKIEDRAKTFNTNVSKSLELSVVINKASVNRVNQALDDIKKNARAQAKAIENAFNIKLSTRQIISTKGVDNAREMLRILPQIANEIRNMPPAPVALDPAKLDALIGKLDQYIGKTNAGGQSLNSTFGQSAGLLGQCIRLATQYFSATGLANFVSQMVRITGELEYQRMALKNIIQDADKADEVFAQIKDLAIKSPFTLQELTGYTKQLAAFSFPKEELFETNKMLADVAAGLGVSMDRLILAYGQVRAASFLRGQEVRQFTEAGIPILEMLAQQFSEVEGRMVSAAEVFNKISARQVPFEMVAKAFKDMTSEGGKFYNMQEVLSQTLQGRIMKLKDSWQIAMADMGNSINGTLKGAVDFAIKLVNNLDVVLRVLGPIVAMLGVNGIVKDLSRINKYVSDFTDGLRKAGSVSKGLFTTWSGWGVVLGAITGIGVAIWQAYEAATKFRKEIEAIKKEKLDGMNQQLTVLEHVKEKLDNTTEGTQNYRDAIHELNSKLGEFLPELAKEADGLNAVRDAAKGAKEAIRAKSIASANDAIRQRVNDKYRERIANEESNIASSLQDQFKELTSEDAYAIVEIFKGALSSNTSGKNAVQLLDEAVSQYLGRNAHSWAGSYALGLETLIKNFDEDLAKQTSDLNARFDTHYETKAIADQMAEIDKQYKLAIEDAQRLTQDQDAYNEAVKKADIEKLRKIIQVYKEAGNESAAKPYKERLRALTAMPTGWQKLVDDALAKRGAKGKGRGDLGLWAEATDNYWDYVDALQKGYKEATGKLQNLGKQANTEIGQRVKDEVAARKAVAAALGITLYEKGQSTNREANEAEKAIKTQIDGVKEVQRAYKELIKDGFSEKEADSLINVYFSYMDAAVRTRRDFWNELLELADKLEKYDANAAERLRADVGRGQAKENGDKLKDEAKAAKEASKELEKYLKLLSDWEQKNSSELTGIGVEYKVSKAISAYNKAIYDADRKFEEGMNHLYASTEDGGERSYGIALLDEQRMQQQENALATLRATIVEFYDDIYNKQMEGYDLTNLERKSLEEIKTLIEAVAGIQVPDDVKKLLEQFPEILKLLEDRLNEKKDNETNNNFRPKEAEKERKIAANIAKYVNQAATGMKKFAEASRNTDLADMADNLSMLAETWSAVIEGAKSGNVAEAILAGLATVFEQSMTYLAKAAEKISVAREAVASLKAELEETRFSETLESGVDTIFGEDLIRQMRNAVVGLNELRDTAQDLKDEFIQVRDAWIDANVAMSGGGGGQSPSTLDDIKENLRQQMQSWEDLLYEYTPEGGLGRTPMYSLREIAEKLGMSLYDSEYDIPNAEFLKKVMELLGIEGDEDNYLTKLKNYSENYVKAMKQMEEVTKELFGGLSSDLADKFIDNFKKMGDAVYDLGDIFEDLGETILRSFLQSYILDNILKKYEKEATKMLAGYSSGEIGYEEYAVRLADLANRIKDETNALAPAINGMAEAFLDNGLLGLDSDSANSLGGGIKSITEETASLLASYINAMRADLSFMRTLQEKGWGTVDIIGQAIPTLSDYLAQIAATNFDIAQSNQGILSELRSVIGAEGSSGSIVRVQMA